MSDSPSEAVISGPILNHADRYSRQMRFAEIGEPGQVKLRDSRVLVCGCGALGSVIAETLVRAGVGFTRIVDRDFVELSNLQRQVLFDEQDVIAQLPKAVAAAKKLSAINSQVRVEPIVADIVPENILGFAEGMDVILDGTDNFEVRFLINDASLTTGIPWIHGGCLGSHGQVMTIIPGETACLRCLIDRPPEASATESCDTAGVLGPAIQVVAALQCIAAMKLLTGQAHLIPRESLVIDVWSGMFKSFRLDKLREQANCPACHRGERLWLSGKERSQTVSLCGRNAVQISRAEGVTMDFDEMARRWTSLGTITRNPFLMRLAVATSELEITLFRDGRAIIKGTDDTGVARAIYSRYVGN